jgi:hypothetical protein
MAGLFGFLSFMVPDGPFEIGKQARAAGRLHSDMTDPSCRFRAFEKSGGITTPAFEQYGYFPLRLNTVCGENAALLRQKLRKPGI